MDKNEDVNSLNINLPDIINGTFLELVDVNLDHIENGIDYFLEDDSLIKEIPVIRIIASVIKTGVNIQNRIFAEKLFNFIKSVNKEIVTENEKTGYLEKIRDKKYRQKVGSTIFSFLNNFNELEKADLLGTLFKNYILDKYSYEIFIEFANAVENIMISDLNLLSYLYKNRHNKYYLLGNLDIENFTDDKKLLLFSSARRLTNLNIISSKDNIMFDEIENPEENMSENGYFQSGGHDLALKINNLGILFFENVI